MGKFQKGNQYGKLATGIKKSEHIRPSNRLDWDLKLNNLLQLYTSDDIQEVYSRLKTENPSAYMAFYFKGLEMVKESEKFDIKMELEAVKMALDNGESNNNRIISVEIIEDAKEVKDCDNLEDSE